MTLKYIENLAQQLGCEPANRLDVHDRHPSFRGDGLDPAISFAVRYDFSSGTVRIARIEHPDRNVAAHCWRERRRMQALGPEVCQLRRFVEGHTRNPKSVRA